MPTSSKMKSRSAESPLKFKTTNRNSLITRFPSHMSTVSRLSETIIVQGRCHWFGGIRLSSAHSTELLSMDLTVSQILEAMLSLITEKVVSKSWKTQLLILVEIQKKTSLNFQTCLNLKWISRSTMKLFLASLKLLEHLHQRWVLNR